MWEEVYGGVPSSLIALTDTFTTKVFLKVFYYLMVTRSTLTRLMEDFLSEPDLARRWTGLRQDSGDPLQFGPRVKQMYQSLDIAIESKTLIYSDALTVDKCLEIKEQCNMLGFPKGESSKIQLATS
jgi:nicotinate phosphoribosyltransferase